MFWCSSIFWIKSHHAERYLQKMLSLPTSDIRKLPIFHSKHLSEITLSTEVKQHHASCEVICLDDYFILISLLKRHVHRWSALIEYVEWSPKELFGNPEISQQRCVFLWQQDILRFQIRMDDFDLFQSGQSLADPNENSNYLEIS